MRFECIFGSSKCLHAVAFEEHNEFVLAFERWNDMEYLHEFFEEHKMDLEEYYPGITVDEAINKTREEARWLENVLFKLKDGEEIHKLRCLSELFKPLDNKELKEKINSEQKAKASINEKWLRLYAIKVEEDIFLITGSAIKLTYKMDDRPHTRGEIAKIDKVRNYLISDGVYDIEGLLELEYR